MEIEVSAFGNFSTDTGSTDCNQVNINVFRFRRRRSSVPHGANFSYPDVRLKMQLPGGDPGIAAVY